MFRVDENHVMDAIIHSNRAHFVNHNCDSNTESVTATIPGLKLVAFRAKRPIFPFPNVLLTISFYLKTRRSIVCAKRQVAQAP